jgi:metal-responsive CopG/Arc/MetJ family transcriptional regulator
MTNITLSINDETYKRMKGYSEIKWSEFVRACIQKRINELESLQSHPNKEGIITMLASEKVLKKDWDNELDERWNNV